MGTYLSTPVTEKNEESGESLQCPVTPLAWGVMDMQGWRKSMEDSHVAQTDIDVPAHHFDGPETKNLNVDGKVFAVFDGHGGPEVARFCQLYLVSTLTQQPTWQFEKDGGGSRSNSNSDVEKNPAETDIGEALISAFHALDRMIDDPARREELIRLRAISTLPGERKDADHIPPPPLPLSVSAPEEGATEETESSATPASTGDGGDPDPAKQSDEKLDGGSTEVTDNTEGSPESTEESKAEKVDQSGEAEGEENDINDSDSDEAVGKEEAVEDQDMLSDDDAEDATTEAPASSTAEKVSEMFQRMWNISGTSGQFVAQVQGESTLTREWVAQGADGANRSSTVAARVRPSQPLPTMLQNGRLVCNLPDHPIHAGATAIVAVIVGKTLTVANAGDSRAVLCRDGDAFPLSFDHKPQSEIERGRIQKAGGFVNQVGRVNGNLNLSRSIGDLKYKQVQGITKAEQMITAEPDILQTTLEANDEFMLLGCDGIWDCLTNQAAVDYVRARIDSKTPTEIGAEMLNDIISEDPRVTQGIGGDNMTIMIVDLQPRSRSYRVADASPI